MCRSRGVRPSVAISRLAGVVGRFLKRWVFVDVVGRAPGVGICGRSSDALLGKSNKRIPVFVKTAKGRSPGTGVLRFGGCGRTVTTPGTASPKVNPRTGTGCVLPVVGSFFRRTVGMGSSSVKIPRVFMGSLKTTAMSATTSFAGTGTRSHGGTSVRIRTCIFGSASGLTGVVSVLATVTTSLGRSALGNGPEVTCIAIRK